jgi:hypothetical protein
MKISEATVGSWATSGWPNQGWATSPWAKNGRENPNGHGDGSSGQIRWLSAAGAGGVAAKALGWVTRPILWKKRDWELIGETLHGGAARSKVVGGARLDERSPALAWSSKRGVGPAWSCGSGFAAVSLPYAVTIHVVPVVEGNGGGRGDPVRKAFWRQWPAARLSDGHTAWERRSHAGGRQQRWWSVWSAEEKSVMAGRAEQWRW